MTKTSPELPEKNYKSFLTEEDARKDTSTILGFAGYMTAVKKANARISELKEQLQKASEFKSYVHGRLDEMGIDKDPESPHKEAGCRIGGRLDIVQSEIKALREERDKELIAFAEWISDGRPFLYDHIKKTILNKKELLGQFKASRKICKRLRQK